MNQCPVCYSSNVKPYKRCGVAQLKCHSCGYDSGERDPKLFKLKKDKDKDGQR
jgi:transposase-like protein